MKKILTYSLTAAFLASAALTAARANAQDIVASSCPPTAADFTALQAIQTNSSLTPTQELNQELALRRQLLAQTIACATADAQSLQITLAAISPTTAAGQSIQSQLSGNIDNAITFYGIEAAKVNTAGVSATEAIAKEMLSWRSANYVPLEGDVNNFLLWSQNQALFETAQNRLTQTGQVVSFIQNAATGNANLATALAAAQSSFNEAWSENTAAGTEIGQVQPSDQTLALIQQSLQSLADTYQKFSDLNAFIQTLLPTTSQ